MVKNGKVALSPGVCHDVSEGSSLQKLHDDPELVSHQVAVVHVNHVLVMVVPHDHHLKHKEGKKWLSTDMLCFYWNETLNYKLYTLI